jgi:hypothetical protein
MGRWVGRAALLAGVVLAGTVPASNWAASQTDEPGIRPGTQFTSISAQVLTDPAPVLMSDGTQHLAYGLLVTNPTTLPVQLDTVEVQDAADGRVLHSLSGADLAAQLSPLGTEPPATPPADPPPPIASTATVVVWLDVVVPTRNDVPRTIDHRMVGSTITPNGPVPFDVVVLPIDVSKAEPLVLAAPVRGGTWLMSDGCCTDVTHHRHGLAPVNGELMVPQRFAIDFYKLDGQQRAWAGDPSDVDSYFSYEQPAVAAAKGVVVVASDGRPDQQPPHAPSTPPIADTAGNHVIVKVSSGVFLLYAHLKPDTVAVRVGQRVKVGDRLGLIGTSGFSSTPHLHFQVLTEPRSFPSDSTPYVFERFDLVGRETERIWDDNIGLQPTGAIPFAPAADPGTRRDALPLDRDVVTFPSRPSG